MVRGAVDGRAGAWSEAAVIFDAFTSTSMQNITAMVTKTVVRLASGQRQAVTNKTEHQNDTRS